MEMQFGLRSLFYAKRSGVGMMKASYGMSQNSKADVAKQLILVRNQQVPGTGSVLRRHDWGQTSSSTPAKLSTLGRQLALLWLRYSTIDSIDPSSRFCSLSPVIVQVAQLRVPNFQISNRD